MAFDKNLPATVSFAAPANGQPGRIIIVIAPGPNQAPVTCTSNGPLTPPYQGGNVAAAAGTIYFDNLDALVAAPTVGETYQDDGRYTVGFSLADGALKAEFRANVSNYPSGYKFDSEWA